MKRTNDDHERDDGQRKTLVDRAVIEGCKARKREAFADLYNSSLPYVLYIVRNYIQCEETVKDIVQEIYSKTFLAIDSYSFSKGPFRPWLRKIIVNQCLMYLREKSRKEDPVELSEEIVLSTGAGDESYVSGLRPEVIRQLLGLMPTGYRTVFTLVVMNGYSHEEAGQELGISTQTSRSQLARSKKWLRNYLNSNHNFIDHG